MLPPTTPVSRRPSSPLIMKKFLYAALMWVVRLTWGILDSLIGMVTFLIFLIAYRGSLQVRYIANTIVVKVGNSPSAYGWGFSAGIFIFSSTDGIWSRDYLLYHEWGHTWPQLLATGPLHPFLVIIPSVIRFWWRSRQTGKELPSYDSIWFEGTATNWGRDWFIWGTFNGLWQ